MTTRNMVFVDNKWQEVYEVPHQDNGKPEFGPLVGVVRVSDGKFLKVGEDGEIFFDPAERAGAAERLTPVPGAYVAIRARAGVVMRKAGPWLQ